MVALLYSTKTFPNPRSAKARPSQGSQSTPVWHFTKVYNVAFFSFCKSRWGITRLLLLSLSNFLRLIHLCSRFPYCFSVSNYPGSPPFPPCIVAVFLFAYLTQIPCSSSFCTARTPGPPPMPSDVA